MALLLLSPTGKTAESLPLLLLVCRFFICGRSLDCNLPPCPLLPRRSGENARIFAQFWCNISPFRINTCKSVSKQRTLTTFRMNTYEKIWGGGGHFCCRRAREKMAGFQQVS